MGMEVKFTLFKHKKSHVGHDITIDQAIERIRNNKRYLPIIEKLRSLPTEEEEDKLKAELPMYCWSGQFIKRSAQDCYSHSGLICLDFDDETKENVLKNKEYIFAAFLSPTGTGVKVLVRIPPNKEDHPDYYEALADYFNLPTIDMSCKDLARGCFDTYDPDLYYNPDAPVFYKKLPKQEIKRVTGMHQSPYVLEDDDRIIQRLLQTNKDSFVKGNRNNYIHKLACDFNRFGVHESKCHSFCQQYIGEGFSAEECKRTIRSAYEQNKHEYNTKTFKDTEPINFALKLKRAKVDKNEIIKQLQDQYKISSSKAESMMREADKINHLDFFWNPTKNNKDYVSIDFELLHRWYKTQGIYRYILSNGTWILIHMKDGIVEQISIDDIKDIVQEYFKQLPEIINDKPKTIVFAMITNQLDRNYLREDKLAWIEHEHIVWQEDTFDTAYFQYQNKIVEINKNTIFTYPHTANTKGCIWKDQIIDRQFTLIESIDTIKHGEFFRFIWNIVTGHDEDVDQDVVANFELFNNMCRVIGYILHSYKDPANPRAVILTDEVISDNPEGGIGKGVFIKGLSKIKNVTTIDGKNFNWAKSFLWQRITLSTQIMAFEDVGRKFDFEKLFSIITEGIEVEKKNKESFYIKYDKSPKVLITSNYVVQGQGGSHDRRRIEIELKQFYSPSFSPRDKFGHNLYDDWDANEWNLFDNFMMYCVQQYLIHGIAKPKNKNLKYKKLVNDVPEEFIQYFENHISLDSKVELKVLCDDFRTAYHDHAKVLNRTISKWIKDIATYKGWEYSSKVHNNGTYIYLKSEDKTQK